jgi:hypothetical protein
MMINNAQMDFHEILLNFNKSENYAILPQVLPPKKKCGMTYMDWHLLKLM